jgi:proteasome lid subunit RPN8/RPN11
MFEEAFWMTRSDGREVEGFLFGDRPGRGEPVLRLSHATETGEAAVRTSTSLLLDNGRWKAAESWVRANEWDECQAVGIWHTHPEDDGTPSDADLRGFLGLLDWNEEHRRTLPFTVGLILSRDRQGSWGSPEIAAWVTRREGYARQPVTEPATVRRRY